MSHISKIKTQIVEKEFLLAALKDLGYKAEEGELSVSGFGANKTSVDILIKIPLSNDIGFRKAGDHYEIVADWFGVRGVNAATFTDKVNQRYAYLTTRAKLEEQGFTLVQETQEKGKIHLVLRRLA